MSTIEYHRAQIRDHLRYRVPTAADQETLTDWRSGAVSHAERRSEASHRKPPPLLEAVREQFDLVKMHRRQAC